MRLIDADSLLEALHRTFHEYEEDIEFTNGIDFAMGLINEQTTIDVSDLKEIFEIVMPVVKDCYEAVLPIVKEQTERPKGKWTYEHNENLGVMLRDVMICSNCGICHTLSQRRSFCSNCGADMRGDTN